jgi:membrane-bound lytic murein transglycosylase MltF
MAQFMPTTSDWISGLYSQLATNEPRNPAWAIRALVVYDRYLYDRVPVAATHCDQMAFTLSSYNGGLGWLNRDAALAAKQKLLANKWFNNVEMVNAGRAKWAVVENRGYVQRILTDLELRYNDAGWGIKSC